MQRVNFHHLFVFYASCCIKCECDLNKLQYVVYFRGMVIDVATLPPGHMMNWPHLTVIWRQKTSENRTNGFGLRAILVQTLPLVFLVGVGAMVGGPQHYQCSTFLPDNLVFYVKLSLEYSGLDQQPVAKAIRSMHKAG